ncbi:hypothetical protein ACJJTC_001364 [Scirpophaga incertulas]
MNKKKRIYKHKSQGKSKSKIRKNKNDRVINKKSLFNRYKNKQKIKEEMDKKCVIEKQFLAQKLVYSESEEEGDVYDQLVTCFTKESNSKRQQVVDSDIESDCGSEHLNDVQNKLDSNSRLECEEQMNLIQNNGNITDNENEVTDDEVVDSDLCDSFTKHYEFDLSDELLVSLSNTPPSSENVMKTWDVLGNLSITIPKPVTTIMKKMKPKITILEEKKFAPTGMPPLPLKTVDFDKLYLKSQIHGNIVSANKKNLIKWDLEISEIFTPLQKELFAIMNNYQDLLYSERTFSKADEICYIYCLHVINHMLKTRTKIVHHNAKISKKSEHSEEEFRDQGIVRPKVLILVPFKSAAYKIVKTLIDILVPKESGQVVNKNRFEEDFTGGELLMPKKNPKPEDYELMFSGNTEDTFRVGMTITKKTLKLYTDFYASDIIVASPLGLRILVGVEGEEERDFDFLASIELLIMDQADVFLMQNWDHLLHVLDHFHLQPKKTHGTDFSRVRMWAVNGWSKYYRQTLIFSSIALPEIKSIMNKKCQNYAGKVIVDNPIEHGSIRQVVLQVPHIYHRFKADSPLESVEARFEYFIKHILPKQRDPLMSHTLIYVPSYFDYVRLRNYFKKEDIGFVQICEYSKDSKIARARDMFFHTEAHFLLYSERVHFFRRFRIKGIRHIIFYQPPTYPHFYSEMCNLMQESNQNRYGGSECNMTVSVLCSRYDAQRAAALTGAARAARALSSDRAVHVYLTGD